MPPADPHGPQTVTLVLSGPLWTICPTRTHSFFGVGLLHGRGRAILLPFDIALGAAHAGRVHRTIRLGTVSHSGFLHSGLRRRAGILCEDGPAYERERYDCDQLLHRFLRAA